MMKIKSKILLSPISLILVLSLSLCACDIIIEFENGNDHIPTATLDSIPEWDGETAYVIINENIPFFTEDEIVAESYENYGELDGLGRCTVCIACVGVDIMPTEERGDLASITPTGWEYNGISNNNTYDFVENGYVYNRCHLIGFQLAGENDNERNLITGTRYMNVEGMLPFENEIANYVKRTENHVLYRVTPLFAGDNLVADGVLLEALSVEDNGAGVCFSVFVYNVQPGIVINYLTGESHLASEPPVTSAPSVTSTPSDAELAEPLLTYIVNSNTMKFHKEDCRHASSISEQNRDVYVQRRSYLIRMGFDPCGTCKP